MSEPLLEVDELRITSHFGEHTIVGSLDLRLEAGETIGIVGESGSGKTLTARAIMGLLPKGVEASGSIRFEGRELIGLPAREQRKLWGSEMTLLMQDPFTLLNPLHRCGIHISESMHRNGTKPSPAERHAEAVRRLGEVGISDPDVASRYPFQLSGGMRQRVGIAAALAADPKLLVADEPTTAVDVTTQREILALLRRIQQARGMGLILITHDLRVAFSMCDRVYVLYAGSLVEAGPADLIERDPAHPYTLGLLLSEPPADRRLAELSSIAGAVPRYDDVAGRCPFSPRCEWAGDACTAGRPPLADLGDGRVSACVRLDEIRQQIRTARAHAHAAGSAGAVTGEPLVEVKDLSKVFAGGKNSSAVHAVKHASLIVRAGESVGLVGESGSGKTTLARCVMGLETPTAGTILIDGLDGGRRDSLSRSDRRRLYRTAQMVFQDPYSSLNPVRSIAASLRDALTRRPRSAEPTTVAGLLDLVGLPGEYMRRKPSALSGGERQRVAIARALAPSPQLLVCDESLSALDVSVQAQILELLRRLQRELGLCYLFITHDLAVVRQIADRVYVMHRGSIVEEGPVDAVLERPTHWYTSLLLASVPRADSDWLTSGAGR
jgi:oligopeptide/dipeptide ABC transporter ATP-binding protein